MAWRMAKSLDVLLKQVNERWPGRSKASDGGKGDDKHAARKSDHNVNSAGIVTARDFTHDPKHGLDARELAEALLASKDPRIKYIISNGEIASGTGANHPAWKWRPYSGVNAHRKHVHISVKADKALYDSAAPWKLDGKAKKPAKALGVPTGLLQTVPAPSPIIQPDNVVVPVPVAVVAPNKEMIQAAQRRLAELGYNPGGIDGIMGPLTKGAVLDFRNDNGLIVTDQIDADFLAALWTAKPRAMVPARANATPAQVAAVVPETKVHWWNKTAAKVLGGGAAATGAIDYIAPATGYLQPVKDFIGDVPAIIWIVGVLLIAGALYLGSLYGENKGVQAFRDGDRR